MSLAQLLILLYFALVVVRHNFVPRVSRRMRANLYDRKGKNEEAKRAAQRVYYPLRAAELGLKAAAAVMMVIAVALVIWFVWTVGALLFYSLHQTVPEQVSRSVMI